MGRNLASLLVFSVLAALAAGAASGEATSAEEALVPPDRSLTVEQYVELGMPPVGLAWTADQRAVARLTLRELAERDPTRLPRFASSRSGSLFSKLVEEEFFRRDVVEGRIGEMTGTELDQLSPEDLARAVHRDSLEGIYAPAATGGLLFDRELVEMNAQQLGRALEHRAEIEALGARIGEAASSTIEREGSAESYRELLQKPSELLDASDLILVQQLSTLAAFAVAEPFTQEARTEAVLHLEEYVPRVVPLLHAEPRSWLHEILTESASAPGADPRLRSLLAFR